MPLFAAKNKPLTGALLLSAALHATIVMLPYLGRNTAGKSEANVAGIAVSQTRLQVVDLAPAQKNKTNARGKVAQYSIQSNAAPAETGSGAAGGLARSGGTDLLPIPAPAYYPTDQLTKKPQPEVGIELDSPALAGLADSGKIILTIWIDENGGVTDIKLDKTNLPETITAPIVAIFRRSQFQPGERSGKRVGSIMKIEVDIDSRPPLH